MSNLSEEQSGPERVSRRRDDSPRSERATRSRQRATRQGLSEKKEVSVKKEIKTPKPKNDETRKAPTPFAGNKLAKAKKRKQIIIVGLVLVLGVGTSAMVGFLDEGQIDVEKTIEARNERVRNNTADEKDSLVGVVEVPVQNTNTNSKPNGGLVGASVDRTQSAPEPELDLASSTATSSLSMSSSTEAVASSTDEAVEEQEEEEGVMNEEE